MRDSGQLEVRPAAPADIPVLRALADEIWRAHYPGIITPEQIDYMLARMYSPEVIEAEMASGVPWAVSLVEQRPAGFLSFGMEPGPREVKLHKLYLLPEWQGRGHGRSMLSYVTTHAAGLGAARIRLQVNKRNQRAIRAYERAGFRVEEAVVADIGGGFVMDDYIMVLELSGVR